MLRGDGIVEINFKFRKREDQKKRDQKAQVGMHLLDTRVQTK